MTDKEKKIKPTSENEEHILEDKDFLLIQSIRDLTTELKIRNSKS